MVERLGIASEEWPAIRRWTEESVRWDLQHGPLTPVQLEARIAEEAQRLGGELGIPPEEVIAEAERIAEMLPEGWP